MLTIIVPTMNRLTLDFTVESLQKQTQLGGWRAVLVGDGCLPPDYDDPRIVSVKAPMLRDAGLLRNHGLRYAFRATHSEPGDWVGFVDDDDVVSDTYVERWNELRKGGWDALVYQMLHYEELVPSAEYIKANRLEHGAVGISFLLRMDIFKVFHFLPRNNDGGNEDYNLIRDIYESGFRVKLVEECHYHVMPRGQWGRERGGHS